LRSSGHSQLSPVVNGAYDYLAIDRTFEFGWFNALGTTLSNADFDQPIDWLAGINGTGGGSFSFKNQKWLGGNDQAFSGSAGDLLTDASGRFSLSTMHVSEVPEPDTLALFFAGALVVVGIGRRRVRSVACA
jgi:hypothetical protein